MVAQQVIGKATRDALFFSHFPVSLLPKMLICGSVLSGAVVWLTTRLVARFGPARVAPVAFAAQGVAVLIEWALASRFESQVALVLYLQTIAIGAMLVSAFWSMVSEAFDPHTAKRVVGQIGAGAALGGIIGGAIAWSASHVTTVPTMLGVMALLSAVCTWGSLALARGAPTSFAKSSAAPSASSALAASGFTALRETPYLRLLAVMVLLGALAQALLDYALGIEATATYGGGARLLAFFAVFQTIIGITSFLLQLSANRFALDRLGIGGTMALLPAAVVAFGALVLVVPSLATVAVQRGADNVLRASLFRSAYEVLYTPVTQALKRPTKIMVDVSFDRLGLMMGSALTLGIVALFPHHILLAVTLAAMSVAMGQLLVARHLHHGYVSELTLRLRAGTLTLDPSRIVDATTRSALSQTLASLDRATLLQEIAVLRARGQIPEESASEPIPEYPELETGSFDDVVTALVDLRSSQAGAILRGLQSAGPELALPMLALLGRDDVARDAARALSPFVPSMVGAIVDVVLDARRPSAVRRRAARLLSEVSSQHAASALTCALDVDARDVRHVSARVLLKMREKNPDLTFDAEASFARARREISVRTDGEPGDACDIEHAFNVLSLTLPREPMQLAYGAMFSRDPYLRGVALEYLDSVLPTDLRVLLSPRLAKTASSAPRRSNAPPLEELLRSKDAIQLNIETLRRAHNPDGEAN